MSSYADNDTASRTRLLLGDKAVQTLDKARVIIFGIGGVGSWCAEALARTGVGHIAIVDSDTVVPSNINRQLVADFTTFGQLKTTVMAQRIRAINPRCTVHAVAGMYNELTADNFHLDSYDVVVDAIDSVAPKIHLILSATACRHARLVSSMGAALKTDVLRIGTAWFDDVKGCPLARTLRQQLRRRGEKPRRPFRCVYSPQLVPNRRDADTGAAMTANGPKRVNGTLVTTTATFGLALAQLALDQLLSPDGLPR